MLSSISSISRPSVRQCARRVQSTLTETHASTSTLPAERRRPATTPGVQRRSRTAFVRPWDGINSVPEALAVVRGVEKHFGKVLDLQLVRDLDRADVFQPYFRVEFKEEFDVPDVGAVVRVKVPLYNQNQTGGPGLLDIRDYLEARDKTTDDFLNRNLLTTSPDGLVEEEGFRIVDVKVEKTKLQIRYTSRTDEFKGLSSSRILQFGQAFAQWGGFAPQPVLSDDSTITSRMTEAQLRWKTTTRRARPAELSSDSELAKENEAPLDEVNAAEASEAQEATETTISEPEPSAVVPPPSAPTVTPIVEVKVSDKPREKQRLTPSQTRRQRLLAQARELAKQPLPQVYTDTPEAKAEKAAQEEQEQKALQEANASLMTKVWKLFGGGGQS